jgi:hypothetical protein
MKFDKERFKTANPLARVIVLTADQFEDFELFVPYFRFMEEGIAVDVAAPVKEKITGENGYVFENVTSRSTRSIRGCTTCCSSPAATPMGLRGRCAEARRRRPLHGPFSKPANRWLRYATDRTC